MLAMLLRLKDLRLRTVTGISVWQNGLAACVLPGGNVMREGEARRFSTVTTG